MSTNKHEDRGELGGFPNRAEDNHAKSVFKEHPQTTQPVKKEEVIEQGGTEQELKPDSDTEKSELGSGESYLKTEQDGK